MKPDPSVNYLRDRLRVIEGRVRASVDRRRAVDPSPDDPFRGLYLSDSHVDQLLSGESRESGGGSEWAAEMKEIEDRADAVEAEGIPIRLRSLTRLARLQPLDVELLLVALAPDIDARFESLYGYLHDDVTRRRASIGLSLELAGLTPWSAEARSRLSPSAPLITLALVLIEQSERHFLTRALRVPDRVAAHLLGDEQPDPALSDLQWVPIETGGPWMSHRLGDLVTGPGCLVYLKERAGSSAPSAAAGAFSAAGLGVLALDLTALTPGADVPAVAQLALREAVLTGSGIVVGPVEALAERGAECVRSFTRLGVPIVLYGRSSWHPDWSRTVPLLLELPQVSAGERLGYWEQRLGSSAPPGLAEADVTTQFLLSAEQVARAADSALLQARLDEADLAMEHLRAGARSQNSAGLEKLARRIEPAVGWEDLVLAPAAAESLQELSIRARRRALVIDQWGMRPGGGRGRGVTALFAGDSGTGKTMSAEVVARDLGLDLYTVNLATVVDKYVGETEKNLERIFSEAAGVNAVLLFDEADALFGKRSEVRDSNDRYANVEVAYLLQRMETFDGLAILATNLRANVDEAFARRLDLIVDFPMPDGELRLALWERCLPPTVPRESDLDLEFCAKAFEISGGNIRSIALTAAYLAADGGRPISNADLMRSVQREYRKLGRLVVSGEFGPYYALVTA